MVQKLASAETAPVNVHGVFNHLVGGDVALAGIAWMGQARIGEVETAVDFGFRQCGVGRIHHHRFSGCIFHEYLLLSEAVALGLDADEILGEGPFGGEALLIGVERKRRFRCQTGDVPFVGEESHLRQPAQEFGIETVFHRPCHVDDGFVAHAVHEQVGAAVDEQGWMQRVAPVVVVRQAAERGLDAADDYGRIRIERLQYAGIDRHGAVGPKTCFSSRCIGIVAPQPQVGRVVVHHGVHAAARYAEEEPRLAQLAEIAQVVAPVGLRYDGHAVAFGLQQSAYYGCAECGMVYVGVA